MVNTLTTTARTSEPRILATSNNQRLGSESPSLSAYSLSCSVFPETLRHLDRLLSKSETLPGLGDRIATLSTTRAVIVPALVQAALRSPYPENVPDLVRWNRLFNPAVVESCRDDSYSPAALASLSCEALSALLAHNKLSILKSKSSTGGPEQMLDVVLKNINYALHSSPMGSSHRQLQSFSKEVIRYVQSERELLTGLFQLATLRSHPSEFNAAEAVLLKLVELQPSLGKTLLLSKGDDFKEQLSAQERKLQRQLYFLWSQSFMEEIVHEPAAGSSEVIELFRMLSGYREGTEVLRRITSRLARGARVSSELAENFGKKALTILQHPEVYDMRGPREYATEILKSSIHNSLVRKSAFGLLTTLDATPRALVEEVLIESVPRPISDDSLLTYLQELGSLSPSPENQKFTLRVLGRLSLLDSSDHLLRLRKPETLQHVLLFCRKSALPSQQLSTLFFSALSALSELNNGSLDIRSTRLGLLYLASLEKAPQGSAIAESALARLELSHLEGTQLSRMTTKDVARLLKLTSRIKVSSDILDSLTNSAMVELARRKELDEIAVFLRRSRHREWSKFAPGLSAVSKATSDIKSQSQFRAAVLFHRAALQGGASSEHYKSHLWKGCAAWFKRTDLQGKALASFCLLQELSRFEDPQIRRLLKVTLTNTFQHFRSDTQHQKLTTTRVKTLHNIERLCRFFSSVDRREGEHLLSQVREYERSFTRRFKTGGLLLARLKVDETNCPSRALGEQESSSAEHALELGILTLKNQERSHLEELGGRLLRHLNQIREGERLTRVSSQLSQEFREIAKRTVAEARSLFQRALGRAEPTFLLFLERTGETFFQVPESVAYSVRNQLEQCDYKNLLDSMQRVLARLSIDRTRKSGEQFHSRHRALLTASL